MYGPPRYRPTDPIGFSERPCATERQFELGLFPSAPPAHSPTLRCPSVHHRVAAFFGAPFDIPRMRRFISATLTVSTPPSSDLHHLYWRLGGNSCPILPPPPQPPPAGPRPTARQQREGGAFAPPSLCSCRSADAAAPKSHDGTEQGRQQDHGDQDRARLQLIRVCSLASATVGVVGHPQSPARVLWSTGSHGTPLVRRFVVVRRGHVFASPTCPNRRTE